MICRNAKCKAEIPDDSIFCSRCGKRQDLVRAKKRRGHGQGTAIKRRDIWTAIWTERTVLVAEEDGTRRVKQVQRWKGGFPNQTKALAYAANPPKEEKEKAVRSLRFYYNGWKKGPYLDLSKSKQVAFDIAWAKLGAICDRDIATLTINDLRDVVDSKAQTFYPAKDVKTLLSHLYTRAAAQEDVKTNLSVFIRLPKLEEKEAASFTEDELERLRAAYDKDNDQIIGDILLMIYTGMMPGELLNMDSSMVDWERREIVGAGLKTKVRKKTPHCVPRLYHSCFADAV